MLRMAKFTIRTINSSFKAVTDIENTPDANAAHDEAVRGAIMIAADEIYGSVYAAAVEVIVEDHAGQRVRRSVVSISVGSLALDAERITSQQPSNDS